MGFLALAICSLLCTSALAQPLADVSPRQVPIPRSELRTITSSQLSRSYDLQVKLPPSYARPESKNRRYPVLYINDATYNFQVAAGITHLPMNAGTVEDFIIVGIGYDHASTGDASRVRDYTPTSNPAFEHTTGGAQAYLEFIENEVIPLIESEYRADPARRVLGGHSFGGLFGAFAMFAKPDLFQYYILSSPSFWYHQNVMFEMEETYAGSHKDLPANVYIGIGGLEHPHRPDGPRYEMVEDVRVFERRLLSRGYPGLRIKIGVVEGATHETAFPTVLMNGVLWQFASDREIPFGY